jgi:hypothetical protein
VERCELDECGSGYEPVADSSKYDYEFSGPIKGGEFLEKLSDC